MAAASLAALLALTMVPAVVFAAPAGTVDVIVGEPLEGLKAGGFEAGDILTIPISIADNPGIGTFALVAHFDPEVFEYVSGSLSTAAPSILSSGLWAFTMQNVTRASEGMVRSQSIYMPAATEPYVACMDNGLVFTFKVQVKSGVENDTSTIWVNRGFTNDPETNIGDASYPPQPVPAIFTPLTVNIKADTPPPPPAAVSVGSVPGTVEPSDSFTVPITITDNLPGFAAFVFTLGFDSSVLELTSLEATGALLEGSMMTDIGSASFGYTKGIGSEIFVIDDDGVLCNASFTVKAGTADGTYPISIGLKDGSPLNFVDNMANPLDIGFTDGSVVVKTPVVIDDPTIIVSDAGTVQPGDVFTLPVSIVKNPGFASAILTVNYDSSVLELHGVTGASSLPSGALLKLYTENNMVSLVSPIDITGDIDLFDLVFKVKDGAAVGDTFVSLSIRNNNPKNFINDQGDSVEVDFISGSASVEPANDLDIPGDLDMPSFENGNTWTRVYNGNPQTVAISLKSAIGTGIVTVYYDGSTTAPTNVGDYTVTITVTGVSGYKDITTPVAVGTLSIIKAAAPTITWPTASHITYGDALSQVVLSGGSTEFGSFAWDSSVNMSLVPTAGTYYYPVVFTPNTNTLQNYETITMTSQNVEVVVDKAPAPSITWPTAGTIRQGQTLADAPLSFDSNAFGSYVWASPSTAPAWPGGTYNLTFVPNTYTSENFEPIVVTTQGVFVKVVLPGDIDEDGEITALDAMRILQHAVGIYTLIGDQLIAADIDGDGFITATDATLAARLAAGLTLP